MKKILIIISSIILTVSCIAQTGVGWVPQRAKVRFIDSLYLNKDIRLAKPLRILGATSGTTTLKAADAAGTGTVTLPTSGTIISDISGKVDLGASDIITTGDGTFGNIVDVDDIVPYMIADTMAAYRESAIPLATVTIMGKIVKKTIGWDGATGTDFKWTGNANHAAQHMDLGAIVPMKSRVIAVEIVCTETLTAGGAIDITLGAGNASGGAQFSVAASCDDINEVVGIIDPDLPAAVIMDWDTDTHVWIEGDPDANWDTMTAGKWAVYVTYINYEDI